MLIGLGAVVALQLVFTYAPPLQAVFGSVALAPAEAAVVLALGPMLLLLVEAGKRIARRGARVPACRSVDVVPSFRRRLSTPPAAVR